MILERNYDPVIVFSFSKKECEKLALSMVTLDLTDKDEKVLVNSIFTRCGVLTSVGHISPIFHLFPAPSVP